MGPNEERRIVRTPEEIQARKEAHEQAQQERDQNSKYLKSKADELRASWARICDESAIKSFIEYVNTQRNGLVEISVAGGGADKQGNKVMISSEERLSNLDRAAGIDIIIGYIDRNIKIPHNVNDFE